VQLREADVLARLKPLLEDDSVLKVGQNLKYDALIFLQRGIRLISIDDTMLISYVLEGGLHGHGMDELSELHLSHTPITFSEVTGKGKDKITFDCVPVAEATRYSAEDADVTLRLHRAAEAAADAGEGKRTVYETLERPLVMVLADMERAGITIDPDLLRKLSNDFGKRSWRSWKSRFTSWRAARSISARPSSWAISCSAKWGWKAAAKPRPAPGPPMSMCWRKWRLQGHEIAQKVLDWRGWQKLRGTYTDALPGYINPKTGRVHTSYAMASTSTGRLASTDPNLQNIPVRTEEGRRIRQAFVAAKGTN
jgi:DNA polymerase I